MPRSGLGLNELLAGTAGYGGRRGNKDILPVRSSGERGVHWTGDRLPERGRVAGAEQRLLDNQPAAALPAVPLQRQESSFAS